MKIYIAVLVLLHLSTDVFGKGLREEFTWTRLDYAWPTGRTTRQTARSGGSRGRQGSYGSSIDEISFPEAFNGNRPSRTTARPTRRPSGGDSEDRGDIDYNYETNIPMGANRWRDKLFITVPRRRLGVPSTLNYVSMSGLERHNVPLIPYPDWETNLLPSGGERGGEGGGDKVKLTSVYRVAVDPCNRLWAVDTGNIETLGNTTRLQPFQLVIFDLTTDKVVHRHRFPDALITPASSLALVTVDVEPDACADAFAYIPDLSGYGLVVFDLRRDSSWRVTHNYFHLEPHAGEFQIAGFQFQWNDGVFSIALTAQKEDGHRDAYFHSMAGTSLYRVSTKVLKNETLATRSYHGTDFEVVGDRGALSQTSASSMHRPSSTLFLALVNQNALACWRVDRPLGDISVVQRDDQKMVYPSDVKVYQDEVIVLTNRMPVFLYGALDYDVINFRVWMQDVEKAVEGTSCAVATRPIGRREGGGRRPGRRRQSAGGQRGRGSSYN